MERSKTYIELSVCVYTCIKYLKKKGPYQKKKKRGPTQNKTHVHTSTIEKRGKFVDIIFVPQFLL